MYCANLNINSAYHNLAHKAAEQKSAQNFGGATRLVSNTLEHPRPFMSTQTFLRVTTPFKSKIVGHLPKEFLGLFPDKPKEVFTFLDEFARFSKTNNEIPHLNCATVNLSSGKKLRVTNVGLGNYGTVFKLDLGNKAFAMKVFRNIPDTVNFLFHGPVAETRTDLALSGVEYRDYRKFHIANLKKENDWVISEFIDSKNEYCERAGNSLIRRHDLKLYDNNNRNKVGGVIVDPGGIISKHLDTSEIFSKKALENEFGNIFAEDISPHFSPAVISVAQLPQEEREKAFHGLLNHPNPEKMEGIECLIEFLPEAARKKAFYRLFEHPELKIEKGLQFKVEDLPKEDICGAVRAIINNPQMEFCYWKSRGLKEYIQSDEKLDLVEKIQKKIFAPYKTFDIMMSKEGAYV